MATKIAAAINLVVKYPDSAREMTIIKIAAPMPEIISIILCDFENIKLA